MDLAGSVDQWHDQLDPSFHRHLTRKYKRLRPKGGSRLRLVTDPREIERLMPVLRDFRATRFGERGGVDLVQNPDYFDFYRATALDGAAGRGPARLVALDVGGQPAAVALDLLEPTGEVFLLVGYDLTRLRNYSLGLLIVDQLAQAAIERGDKYLDLTVGDEPYKTDFGARRRELFEVYVAQTLAGNALYTGRLAYRAARGKAKRARLAWRAAAPRLKSTLRRLPGTRTPSSS